MGYTFGSLFWFFFFLIPERSANYLRGFQVAGEGSILRAS
jgi:hypothetical protein